MVRNNESRMKLIITEKQYNDLRNYLTESEEKEYYRISPDEYLKWIKKTNYDASIFESKKFNGLPLYVTGDLDLSELPIESLGNVDYIDGNLDISDTLVKSLGKTKVKGYTRTSNSPLEKINELKNQFKMIAENNQKRIDGKWSLLNENIDEEGLAANALFKYLVRDEILNGIDEDELNEYNEKIKEYSEFLEKFESLKDRISDDKLEKLEDQGNEILFQLSELNDRNKADVYFIIPKGLYGERVYQFKVLGLSEREYLVGLNEFINKAAIEYEEEVLKGIDFENFTNSSINVYLKEDEVEEFIRDNLKDKIKLNPKKYFEELQSEFDAIKPPTEPTDDMIDEKVDELTEKLLNNDDAKIRWLEKNSDITNFIDFNQWAKAVVSYDGYGMLSSEGDSGWFDETVETPTRRYNFHIIQYN